MKLLSKFVLLTCLLAFLLPATTPAAPEELAKKLTDARSIFDSSVEKIDVNFLDMVDKCRDAYGASLVAAEDTVTKKGDLDAVVQIRKEKARFAQDRAVDDEIPPGTHPAVKQAIEIYLKNLATADAGRAQQISAVAKNYIQYLQSIKTQLTRESKIEDALIVNKELEKVTSDPMISEALASQPPPVTSARKGGRCPTCNGTGVSEQPCKDCDSSGICAYCEGSGMRKGLGGSGISCFACTGSKKCSKCKGTGKAVQKCIDCNGSGRL